MADFEYIENTGVIVPDTSITRAQVEAEFQAIFGTDMPLDPSTPQGGIITMLTETRDGVARNNAELANQINPDFAGGVFLDAIWRFTGGQRRPGERSRLLGVELAGIPNTLIPAGSRAVAQDTGAEFETVSAVILDANGQAVAEMVCTVPGPINVGIGGLNSVASGVLGWETVSNPSAAIPGKLSEGDIPARQRRRNTLALQTISSAEAIISALYDIDNVNSLTFRENTSSSSQTIDGITMAAHSIYVCIDGGDNTEIAEALLREKTLGAAFNGSTSVSIVETSSGQNVTVLFDRPSESNVFVRFTVSPSTLDVQNIIPDAVIAYRDGDLEGDQGFTVGKDLSPFELAGAVHQVEPSIFIKKVEISQDSGATWSSNTIQVDIDQILRVTRSSVTVVVS